MLLYNMKGFCDKCGVEGETVYLKRKGTILCSQCFIWHNMFDKMTKFFGRIKESLKDLFQ